MDAALAARLQKYVRTGGTLVFNVEHLAGRFAESFLGARLTGETGRAVDAVWLHLLRLEATFEACHANAVRANDGQALSSKARRKLEKDYASRKRAAEAYAAKEQASLEGAQFACSQSAIDENDPARPRRSSRTRLY